MSGHQVAGQDTAHRMVPLTMPGPAGADDALLAAVADIQAALTQLGRLSAAGGFADAAMDAALDTFYAALDRLVLAGQPQTTAGLVAYAEAVLGVLHFEVRIFDRDFETQAEPAELLAARLAASVARLVGRAAA